MRTRLRTMDPYDGVGVLRYLDGHAIPGVEHVDESSYRRRVRLGGSTVTEISVRLDGGTGVIADADAALLPRIRSLFALDADSRAIDAHLARDPVLATAVERFPGVRLPGALDIHEQLFRTLIGQQISTAAARTVLARLCRDLCGDSGLFPTAHLLAERGRDVLRGPASRIATIHGVAVALASGELVIEPGLSVDELTERLTAISGIGVWTAGYVAMRALGALDVLLTTDLVLLKGASILGLPATPRALADYGRRWAPYRSVAGVHLWRAARAA